MSNTWIGNIILTQEADIRDDLSVKVFDLLECNGGVVDGEVYPILAGKLGYSEGGGVDEASYNSVSFPVNGQDTYPFGITFNSDGTKMYILGNISDRVYQYSLTTAWDLSTASYDIVSFSVGGQDPNPYGIAFNSDGTKMYILGGGGTKKVYQYSLTTALDLRTASYDSVSFSVNGQDTYPFGVTFNSDGTKMYISGINTGRVYQYSLTTAWDLGTASYGSVSFFVGGQDSNPYGISFNSEGTKMYILGNISDRVYQYSLTTAWDLSTASYDIVSFSVGGQDPSPFGITFNSDGTKMYILGRATGRVYQYTLPAGGYVLPTMPSPIPSIPYKMLADKT